MKTNKIIWLIGIIILAVTFYFIIPNQNTTPADWLTFTDEAGIYTYKYPADFGSDYVTPVDWPPQVNLLEGTSFNCTDGAGSIYAQAGETKRKIINGKEYCVTVATEGAAGSIYNHYAYLTEHNDQVIGFVFTARLPQCLNYDEPRQDECKADQAAFNPDVIISEIINSLELTH